MCSGVSRRGRIRACASHVAHGWLACALLLAATGAWAQAAVESPSRDAVAPSVQDAVDARAQDTFEIIGETIEFGEPVLLSRPWHFRSVRDPAIEADMNILRRRRSVPVPDGVLVIGDESDAIIDAENVVRRLRQRYHDDPRTTALCEAALRLVSHDTAVLEQFEIRYELAAINRAAAPARD